MNLTRLLKIGGAALLVPAVLTVAPYLIPLPRRRAVVAESLAEAADRFVEVDGVRVRYRMKGAGTPLVMLHGFASSLVTWRKNFDDLARDHQVIALDLKGWGLSDKPKDSDYSLAAQADLVRGVLRALNIERAIIVGHSMGGATAMHFAVRHPAATRGLVLVASAGARHFPLLQAARVGLQIPPLRRWMKLGIEYGLASDALLSAGMPTSYYDARHLTPQLVADLIAPLRTEGFPDALLGMVRDLGKARLHGRVSEIVAPTLLIWGEHDPLIQRADGEMLRRRLPQAELVVLARAGHLPHEERAEDVNHMIREFVKTVVSSQ